jgi:steroid 5-alpha reductase family enzyme
MQLEFFAIAFGICIVIMAISWYVAKRLNFFSLVDVVWSYGIGLIALLFNVVGNGHWQRRLVVTGLVLFWSLRLGTHLLLRLKAKFPTEDYRYLEIKNRWGKSSNHKFFWFFQFQAISQPILCIPFYLASQIDQPLNWIDVIAFLVCIIAVFGESIADAQLKHFKSTPANKAKVCEVGLWKYSRHPNYFFEWIIWCGFSMFALQSSSWFLGLLSPVVMYLLLNYMTGVPPTESQSIKSKGDLYISYQTRVSRFFLWFPK